MKQRAESGARAARREQWRKVIAAAEVIGRTVSGLCRRYGIHPNQYDCWQQPPTEDREVPSTSGNGRFVLVGTAGMAAESPASLELVVEQGWRLRIDTGVEDGAPRKVLAALAAPS